MLYFCFYIPTLFFNEVSETIYFTSFVAMCDKNLKAIESIPTVYF